MSRKRPPSGKGRQKRGEPLSAAELWSSSPPRKNRKSPLPPAAKHAQRSKNSAAVAAGRTDKTVFVASGLKDGRRLQAGLILLYEDSDILVVHKPAGLLSIATDTRKDRSAYFFLGEYLHKKGEKRSVAVVHRLDRDTSGLLVFAKSDTIKRSFMDHWNELVLERRYIALLEGILDKDSGTITKALGEDRGGKVIIDDKGKTATTHYKVLERYKHYTLTALELETGRRNQIRVHCAFIGHPVAGDKKYGARTDPLGRLALHAESLSFIHPGNGKTLRFSIAPEAGFRATAARS